MTEKPDKIVIRCEACKKVCSLNTIHKRRGICAACQNSTWHLQAIYLSRQNDGDATSLTLKALGFGLLDNDGVSISSPIPSEKRPVNGFDVHDVPAEVMVDIADPEVSPQVKLTAYVRLQQNEQFQRHRRSMEKHGLECEQCGVLFVVSDQKPWTLLGTCSKVCCANKLGAADYALVEELVHEECRDRLPEYRKIRLDQRAIAVTCYACGHQFELPRIYAGVNRICPGCSQKVLVPFE